MVNPNIDFSNRSDKQLIEDSKNDQTSHLPLVGITANNTKAIKENTEAIKALDKSTNFLSWIMIFIGVIGIIITLFK